MGLTLFEENKHASNLSFTSRIDGKRYISLAHKEPFRVNYAYELLRTNVLSFGRKEKLGDKEKIPIEAGYTLTFGNCAVGYQNEMFCANETFNKLTAEPARYGCYSLAKYYAKTINAAFKNINFDFISGPPRGGVSFEVATYMNLKPNTIPPYHLTNDEYCDFVYEAAPNLQEELKRCGKVLICDDCLITGNSIIKEAKALTTKTDIKDLEICGVIVGVDCGLYGKSHRRVSEEIQEALGVKVESIVDIEELIDSFRYQIPSIGYPVKKCEEWIFDINKTITPENIQICKKMWDQYEEEVCKPFAKFMKTQREAIGIEETLKRLRA